MSYYMLITRRYHLHKNGRVTQMKEGVNELHDLSSGCVYLSEFIVVAESFYVHEGP